MGLVYTHYLGNHALQQAVYFWNTIEEYNKEAINHGIEEAVNPPEYVVKVSNSQGRKEGRKEGRKAASPLWLVQSVYLTCPALLPPLLHAFLPSWRLQATGYRSIGVIRLLPPHALPATRPIPIPSINHLVLVFSNK